jgi:hypothetical protein
MGADTPQTRKGGIMDRRNISKFLLGSVVGSTALMSERAMAQSCIAACYAQTAAESSAGVTPVNQQYPPYWVPRYGNNSVPGTTDCRAAIQAAVDAGAVAGHPAYLPGWFGEAKISSSISFAASRSGLLGDAAGASRILCGNTNAFEIAAGRSFITIGHLSIACTRYTDTPNSLTAIRVNGTTASSVDFCTFTDLFIDGFETAIAANGLRNSAIHRILSVYGKNGITANALTTSNLVTSCDLSGGHIAGSVGLRIGDGTAAAEGWTINGCVFYGFARGFEARASANHRFDGNIIDQAGEFGVALVSSTGACTACSITNNLFYMMGACDTAIFLANSVTPSSGAARGHTISGNDVGIYPGSSLTYGLLCEGTHESNHRIIGNALTGGTFDCKVATGSGHVVVGNRFLNSGFYSTVMVTYEGNEGACLSETMVRQTNGKNFTYHENGPPTTGGPYKIGDISWNTAVAAGGVPGYVCVSAGSPGIWKAMANVAA